MHLVGGILGSKSLADSQISFRLASYTQANFAQVAQRSQNRRHCVEASIALVSMKRGSHLIESGLGFIPVSY